MTTRPTNPDFPGDEMLSEESLLALVEGELSETRERQVLAALSARPDLLATVRGMTRDRALLSDLCDVEAPPEVMESIEAALERAALLDGPALFADLPPAPIVMPRARSGRRLSSMLAMAAAIALVAGGVGYWAFSRQGSGAGGGNTGPLIAKNDVAPTPAAERPAPPTTLAKVTPEAAAPSARAAHEDLPVPTEPIRVALSAEPATTEAPIASPGGPGFVGPPLPEHAAALASGVITPELAVELASQGRLAVRVRSREMARTISGLDAIASREGERSWHLSRQLGADDAGASSGLSDLARADADRAEKKELQRAVASESGIGALRLSEARAERHAAVGPRGYFASIALTPESLASLRAALETEGDASVTFEELAGPAQPEVELKDAEPLWWDEAPSRWVPWADVLVVVEE